MEPKEKRKPPERNRCDQELCAGNPDNKVPCPLGDQCGCVMHRERASVKGTRGERKELVRRCMCDKRFMTQKDYENTYTCFYGSPPGSEVKRGSKKEEKALKEFAKTIAMRNYEHFSSQLKKRGEPRQWRQKLGRTKWL